MPFETTELIPHIDQPLSAKAHTPMYLMHKFWARKPHNVVNEYIKHYSKKGEIVLDPFCGSDPTPIEAIKEERKAIAVDLNPVATFITKMTALSVDINDIEVAYEKIKEKAMKEINKLYVTSCPNCRRESAIICSIWKIKVDIPKKIRLYCPNCKKRIEKKPDRQDTLLIKEIQNRTIPFWYPKTKLYYDYGKPYKKKEKSESIPDLFTKRNLIALSILYNEIEERSSK